MTPQSHPSALLPSMARVGCGCGVGPCRYQALCPWHPTGLRVPCTPQAPPIQDPRTLKHPLSSSPLVPCRSQTLQSLILGVLSCSDPTHAMSHIAQTDLAALNTLYATCIPETSCMYTPKPLQPLHVLNSLDPEKPGPGVRYRPCMAQTLHSLDPGCPTDPAQLRLHALWT